MRFWNSWYVVVLLGSLLSPALYCSEQKSSREEAQFDIFVAGKKIGQEKYTIDSSANSNTSHSNLKFKDPARRQEVQVETQLAMDGNYVPLSYKADTLNADQKKVMDCKFRPGEATFLYQADGASKRLGLLVGKRFIVLDDNVFHHFIFVARLFNFSDSTKPQQIEVVIPQELDTGILKVSDTGVEKVSVHGKERELHHLKADSGSAKIDLWVDEQHTLYKIALPAKQIEVIRNK